MSVTVGLWAKLSNWNFNRFFNKSADDLVALVRDYGRGTRVVQQYEIVGQPGEVWQVTVERVSSGRPIGSSREPS